MTTVLGELSNAFLAIINASSILLDLCSILAKLSRGICRLSFVEYLSAIRRQAIALDA